MRVRWGVRWGVRSGGGHSHERLCMILRHKGHFLRECQNVVRNGVDVHENSMDANAKVDGPKWIAGAQLLDVRHDLAVLQQLSAPNVKDVHKALLN